MACLALVLLWKETNHSWCVYRWLQDVFSCPLVIMLTDDEVRAINDMKSGWF